MYKKFLQAENSPCFLCDGYSFRASTDKGVVYVCKTCGCFRLTEEADFDLQAKHLVRKEDRYKLSFLFRKSSTAVTAPGELPLYKTADFPELLKTVSDPGVEGKLALLLSHLADESQHPGQPVVFDVAHDFSVICARNSEELRFHLTALADQEFVREVTRDTFGVTAKGWIEVAKRKATNTESSNGFIAMWFSADRSAYDQAIDSSIRDAGYSPVRVDRLEHVNRIDDEILTQIRRAKFLVADLSGQRTGVYFEAGFMLGLGRPVIWVCQSSEMSQVHFDTRQFNTIFYNDPTELRTRLRFRIEALLGKGPGI